MTFARKSISCLFAAWCCVSLAGAVDQFDQKDFQANATFELVVEKSQQLKPGTSRISSHSAFVSLVHGLMPGKSDGLEVMFFTKPVTQATLPDIMNNDAREMRKSDHAAMVLFLDEKSAVWQVNVSYVVPGTTVARTVAWKPNELKQYFSAMSFKNGRLVLKSRGSYSDIESAQEAITLTWNVDLDLPVQRELKR